MESLDFVYDLLEKLQTQKMDYFLVTIRKGKKGEKADVFYNLNDEEVFMKVLGILQQLQEPEREPTDEELDAIEKALEESEKPKKRTRKSPAKKQPPKKAASKKSASKKTPRKKPTKKPKKK